MLPSDLFTITIAQAIAWLVGTGIALGVSFGLGFITFIPDKAKAIINAVLVAALTAGLTALASFIPDQWLGMKLIDAVFALIAMLLSGWGATKFGTFKAFEVKADAQAMGLKYL